MRARMSDLDITHHHLIPRERFAASGIEIYNSSSFADLTDPRKLYNVPGNIKKVERVYHWYHHLLFDNHIDEEIIAYLNFHTLDDLLRRNFPVHEGDQCYQHLKKRLPKKALSNMAAILDIKRHAFHTLFGTNDSHRAIEVIRQEWYAQVPAKIRSRIMPLPMRERWYEEWEMRQFAETPTDKTGRVKFLVPSGIHTYFDVKGTTGKRRRKGWIQLKIQHRSPDAGQKKA